MKLLLTLLCTEAVLLLLLLLLLLLCCIRTPTPTPTSKTWKCLSSAALAISVLLNGAGLPSSSTPSILRALIMATAAATCKQRTACHSTIAHNICH
jgi:hypothetical protein